MSTRIIKFIFPLIAIIAITGCASYCLGPVDGGKAGARTIEVQPFDNQALQPRLGDALTQSVRQQIQSDGTYKLSTDKTGDIILSGVIRNYGREGLGYMSVDSATPENYRVGAVVHIKVTERASGKLLFERDVRSQTLVHIGTDLASSERQSTPLLAAELAQSIIRLLAEGAW